MSEPALLDKDDALQIIVLSGRAQFVIECESYVAYSVLRQALGGLPALVCPNGDALRIRVSAEPSDVAAVANRVLGTLIGNGVSARFVEP